MKKEDLKYVTAGGLTGIVNGLLGAGGGMVLVPLLLKWCGEEEKKALATSVAVIFPMCAVSAAVYFLKGNGVPQGTVWYLLGGLAGGTAGGILIKLIPPGWLLKAFGAVMLVAGARMLFF